MVYERQRYGGMAQTPNTLFDGGTPLEMPGSVEGAGRVESTVVGLAHGSIL
jgi:hypothetical protein